MENDESINLGRLVRLNNGTFKFSFPSRRRGGDTASRLCTVKGNTFLSSGFGAFTVVCAQVLPRGALVILPLWPR